MSVLVYLIFLDILIFVDMQINCFTSVYIFVCTILLGRKCFI